MDLLRDLLVEIVDFSQLSQLFSDVSELSELSDWKIEKFLLVIIYRLLSFELF